MKNYFTSARNWKQVKGFKTLLTAIAMCCLPNLIKAQTTFSATTLRSDTISSVDPNSSGGVFINDSVCASMQVTMQQNLRVNGNTNIIGKLVVNDSVTFNGTLKNSSLAGTGDRIIYVDPSGNLKVGTGGPNTTNPGPCLSAANPWYEGGNFQAADLTAGTCDNNDFILKSNSINSIWIKPTGKIGFNTPNPNARFEITGTGLMDGIRYNSPNSANTAFEIATNTTFSRFKTYGNGQTFIGQFSSPYNDFDVNGSFLTVGQQLPTNKAFNVVSNANINAPIDLFTVYGNGRTIHTTNNNSIDLISIANSNFTGSPFTVYGNGYTQIGSSTLPTPYKQLTVNGDVSLANYGINPTNGYNGIEILGNNQVPSRRGISTDNDGNGKFNFYIHGFQTGAAFNFKNGASNKTLMSLEVNGNLYVGAQRIISTHIHANSNFQFWGKVACKELVVVDPTRWADFVFNSNYKLAPLSEVEAYYLKNKHLKDVPSEAEVKQNGINTTEMDATLLQKVEELYLYIVEQNKRIEKLEAQNKLLLEAKK